MNSRWLAYALVLVGWMSLGYACKGGGGGDSGEFIMVLDTEPANDQGDVQVATRIGFRIDAAINPDTLADATFFVTDSEGTPVPGTLVFDADEPDVAVLTPDEPLSVLTDFTATITTGLASSNGATLEEDFEWRFTTLDSAWGEDEWLEAVGTGSSSQPQIAVDGQSNALAVWEYDEPAGTRVWASRYTRVDLWGVPEPIDGGDEPSSNPRLATDDAGNGFAVWKQGAAAARTNIWTNRYVVGEGWGTPALLQSVEVTNAVSPSIAADPAGNAIAVWIQREMDGINRVVWASRYEPGSGWAPAASIDPMPSPTAGTKTSVGMDDDGNAIAVWARQTATSTGGRGWVLWANRYVVGEGWKTADAATLIKDDPETTALKERLSVGPNGDAFVVWEQNDPMRNIDDIWGARFSGSAWEPPERLDDHDAGDKRDPDIAVDGTGVDGTGVAHAVWSQVDLDLRSNIWARRYMPGAGWGTPELIEPPNEDLAEDSDAATPRVGVNAAGNAFVVWSQSWQDWASIWSNRLDPEEMSWTPMRAERIEAEARAAKAPIVVVDENRHAHAVWLHRLSSGADWVRTNRFE